MRGFPARRASFRPPHVSAPLGLSDRVSSALRTTRKRDLASISQRRKTALKQRVVVADLLVQECEATRDAYSLRRTSAGSVINFHYF